MTAGELRDILGSLIEAGVIDKNLPLALEDKCCNPHAPRITSMFLSTNAGGDCFVLSDSKNWDAIETLEEFLEFYGYSGKGA